MHSPLGPASNIHFPSSPSLRQPNHPGTAGTRGFALRLGQRALSRMKRKNFSTRLLESLRNIGAAPGQPSRADWLGFRLRLNRMSRTAGCQIGWTIVEPPCRVCSESSVVPFTPIGPAEMSASSAPGKGLKPHCFSLQQPAPQNVTTASKVHPICHVFANSVRSHPR